MNRLTLNRACVEERHSDCDQSAYDDETGKWGSCSCACHGAFEFRPGLPMGYQLGGRVHMEKNDAAQTYRDGDVFAVSPHALGIIWDDERAAGDDDEARHVLWYSWRELTEFSITPSS